MPPSQPSRAPVTPATRSATRSCRTRAQASGPSGHNRGMSLAPPEAAGPLRRERLRTARLYFVCDARPGGEDPEALLRAALERRRRHRPAAREGARPGARSSAPRATFRRVCDTYSALFIVNDDPDLARACDADGVHVGQDDGSVAEARELLGPDAIIGLSTHSEEQIAAAAERAGRLHQRRADLGDADESGAARRSGWSSISHAAEHATHPFFAIGGIDAAQRRAGRRGRGAAALRGAGDPRRRRPDGRGRSAARAGAVAGSAPRWLSERAEWRGAAQAQAAAAAATAMDARLRQGRAAQPGGARGAGAAGRGRAAAGGHGRRRRRRPDRALDRRRLPGRGRRSTARRRSCRRSLAPALIMGVMAWGMWRARYWAVLGFQLILVFLIFSAVFGLAGAGDSTVGPVRGHARPARGRRHLLLLHGQGDGADPDAGAHAARASRPTGACIPCGVGASVL